MSSRGKRSMVWEFFKLPADNKNVVCNLCKKQYKYFKNTTNLKEHLKRVHPCHLLVSLTDPENNDDNESSTLTPSTSGTMFIVKYKYCLYCKV